MLYRSCMRQDWTLLLLRYDQHVRALISRM